MKLATFERKDGSPAIAAVDTQKGELLDLARATAAPEFADMLTLIDGGASALDHARNVAAAWPQAASLPLQGTRLLAPIPVPRQLRDGLMFEEHFLNALKASKTRDGVERRIPKIWYEQPIYYKANRFSVIGPETDVIWPRYSNAMDYECELACVIGTTGKDIAPDKAHEHIFGFTIFNDMTARDAQMAEMAAQMGPAKGKDFDTGNILGPWIVTLDEIGDPHMLDMEARINGERWGGGNSRNMHHKWPAILAHVSNSETLHAGEIICSGTVGTGCGLELGRLLNDGDVIELEISGIGVLRNRLVKR
ncbi:fumarylacetoacetate hydrolase family protein [Roseiarcaceae bacterium H3SJ34-1]|uniref:fumarylacetoacetate hydrolase family protein n=1 Tax=Terripilifer ovatus TaxID=3032367 RepID=UPI003AB95B41|nr:fumarylacetoacetate hydrolase family protein [Roseiarcaceae bacterium H3SJ34-1]